MRPQHGPKGIEICLAWRFAGAQAQHPWSSGAARRTVSILAIWTPCRKRRRRISEPHVGGDKEKRFDQSPMTDLAGPMADFFVNALCIEAMHLVLRRANVLRNGGDWRCHSKSNLDCDSRLEIRV